MHFFIRALWHSRGVFGHEKGGIAYDTRIHYWRQTSPFRERNDVPGSLALDQTKETAYRKRSCIAASIGCHMIKC